MEAAESLESSHGIKASVVDMRFVKPLDTGRLRSIVQKSAMVVTVENNTMLGGFGGAVAEWISEQGIPVPFRRFGLPDRYVPHGRPCDLMHELKLDKPSLVREIAAFYRNAREGGRTVSLKASGR
jgi:1-deoxy-D-xylulose-5-phosphate synthase